jgi:hypothetical protein
VSKTCVFLGPSLPAHEASALLPDAEFLPPVKLGDVYALVRRGDVGRIAIIDGRFESIPAVWHKEILHAMAQGITVAGASSMGALRAAELHAVGMIGMGSVFADFRDGVLEDDDEVALVHGPPEAGHPNLSVAMVTLRHAFRAAIVAGHLQQSLADEVLAELKAAHYAERTWARVEALLRLAGLAQPAEAMGFLRSPDLDIKRLDALELLQALARGLHSPAPAPVFEATNFWAEFVENRESGGAFADEPDVDMEAIVGQCLLRGGSTVDAPHDAWMRVLEDKLAHWTGIDIDADETRAWISALRKKFGLHTAEATEAWLNDRGLDRAELIRWARQDALRFKLMRTFRSQTRAAMVSSLRWRGELAPLVDRIARARARHSPEELDPNGLSREMADRIWDGYKARHGAALGGSLDDHARWLGFDDKVQLASAMILDFRIETPLAHGNSGAPERQTLGSKDGL